MIIDKHVYFNKDEYKGVCEYAKANSLSYSKAVCDLVMKSLNNISVLEKLDNITKKLKYIEGKVKITYLLLEQTYSNFDFENIINVKNSKQLKQFNTKIKGNNISE